MKKIVVLVNFLIFDIYFFLLLYLTFGVSGGDIFLILATGFLMLLHVIIVLIVCFKDRSKLFKSLVGILLGLLLAFIVFEILEFQRSKIEPKVRQVMQSGTTVSTKVTEYGTNVMKSVNIGGKGSIDVFKSSLHII